MMSDQQPLYYLNDEKSFEQLYQSQAKKLYRLCYYYTKDQEESKEIVQEIFKSLWERRDNIEIKVPIEVYLARAAKLSVYRYFRDKSAHEKHLKLAFTDHALSADDTENSVMFSQLSDQIETLMSSLPDQTSKIFRLSRYQGLPHREIASMLLISEKSVEYHITKTITFLRRELSQ